MSDAVNEVIYPTDQDANRQSAPKIAGPTVMTVCAL
jgi:hypothetical protein